MLCKVWKVLCWTQCFPLDFLLDSAPGSDAHLETRQSSWIFHLLFISVPFLSCFYPDLVPEPASKVEETWKIWELWWPSAYDRSWFHSCSQVRYHSEYRRLCIKPLRGRQLSFTRSPLHMRLSQRRRTGKDKNSNTMKTNPIKYSQITHFFMKLNLFGKYAMRCLSQHDPSPLYFWTTSYRESYFDSKYLYHQKSPEQEEIMTFAGTKPCFFIDSISLQRPALLGWLVLSALDPCPCQVQDS